MFNTYTNTYIELVFKFIIQFVRSRLLHVTVWKSCIPKHSGFNESILLTACIGADCECFTLNQLSPYVFQIWRSPQMVELRESSEHSAYGVVYASFTIYSDLFGLLLHQMYRLTYLYGLICTMLKILMYVRERLECGWRWSFWILDLGSDRNLFPHNTRMKKYVICSIAFSFGGM